MTIETDIPNVEIIFKAHPDDVPVEDCYERPEDIGYVKERLKKGDLYAHFTAEVYAVFDGQVESDHEYLGACCYDDAKDFIENSGYFEDMKKTVIENLESKLKEVVKILKQQSQKRS